MGKIKSFDSCEHGSHVSIFSSHGGVSKNSYDAQGELVGVFGAVGFDGALDPQSQQGGLDVGLQGSGSKEHAQENIKTALSGNDFLQKFKPKDLTILTTSYGNDVQVITKAEQQAASGHSNQPRVIEADALITDCPDTPIACVGADAPPIIIRGIGGKSNRPFLALVPGSHLGLAQGVLSKTMNEIDNRFGIDRAKISIDIGPGLGPQSIKKFGLAYNDPDNRPSPDEIKQHHYSASTMEVGISTLTYTALHQSSQGLPLVGCQLYDSIGSDVMKKNVAASLKNIAGQIAKGNKQKDELNLDLFNDQGLGFDPNASHEAIEHYVNTNFDHEKLKQQITVSDDLARDPIFKQHVFKAGQALAFDVQAFCQAEIVRKIPGINNDVVRPASQRTEGVDLRLFDTADMHSPFYGARRLTQEINQDAKKAIDAENSVRSQMQTPQGIDGKQDSTMVWHRHTGLGRNFFVAAIVNSDGLAASRSVGV